MTISSSTVVAVDWGTSRLRLWLLDAEGKAVAERRTDEGLATAAEKGFSQVLEGHLDSLGADPALPVIVCGMAGSRQGWREAPYVETPAALDDIPAEAARVENGARDIRILPGVAQRRADRPDVMRGEETQLLGATGIASDDAVVCMPGTHSKWVRLAGGRLHEFGTFLTGEMYAAIGKHTILSHALEPAHEEIAAQPAFGEAVLRALEPDAALLNQMFAIRSGQLLGFRPRGEGAAQLSGLLVGSELSGARRFWQEAAHVRLIVSGPLAALYRKALELAGLSVDAIDAETAVRRGLFLAAQAIRSRDERM